MNDPEQNITDLQENYKISIKAEAATLMDLRDIQRLNKILFDEEFEKYDQTIDRDWTLSQEGEDFYKKRISGEDGCAFVLKNGEQIIGYLVGSLSDDEFYRNIKNIAELDDMFILEQFRNGGHGSKLYGAFVDWCKTKNVKRIKVLVTAKNKQAINFYKKKGFFEYNITLEVNL